MLGIEALNERLGLADALRFLQQHDPGQGDFTAEREALFSRMTVDQIAAAIRAQRPSA